MVSLEFGFMRQSRSHLVQERNDSWTAGLVRGPDTALRLYLLAVYNKSQRGGGTNQLYEMTFPLESLLQRGQCGGLAAHSLWETELKGGRFHAAIDHWRLNYSQKLQLTKRLEATFQWLILQKWALPKTSYPTPTYMMNCSTWTLRKKWTSLT